MRNNQHLSLVVPQDIDIITAAARVRVPDAVVWRGAPELPATRQGLKVLGAVAVCLGCVGCVRLNT